MFPNSYTLPMKGIKMFALGAWCFLRPRVAVWYRLSQEKQFHLSQED